MEAIVREHMISDRAQAELAQAQTDLDNTRLIAPMDGRITNRGVERGNYVQPGQQLGVRGGLRGEKTIIGFEGAGANLDPAGTFGLGKTHMPSVAPRGYTRAAKRVRA